MNIIAVAYHALSLLMGRASLAAGLTPDVRESAAIEIAELRHCAMKAEKHAVDAARLGNTRAAAYSWGRASDMFGHAEDLCAVAADAQEARRCKRDHQRCARLAAAANSNHRRRQAALA